MVAGAAEPDPVEVLKRASAQVVANMRRVPNYTCVQTVTRNYYVPAAQQLPRTCELVMRERQHPTLDKILQLYLTNRLRLDVTLTKRGEIYSWVGASKFEDSGIDRLVREGPIGSGAFGAFLTTIFNGDVKGFAFEREVTVDGRALMEYSFHVPKPDSHYKVKIADGDAWATTGYRGSVIVDVATADLARLRVETEELPPAAGACLSAATMDYATTQIGEGAFLLPKLAVQRWVRRDGEEAENTTRFSDCREYRGESTITFSEESAPVADGPGSRSGQVGGLPRVPPGLAFAMELTAPIDSETAAMGDRFAARLVETLRDAMHKVLAPKGAPVLGRILRVETRHRPSQEAMIVLRPDSVEIKGVRVLLSANRDWRRAMAQSKGRRVQIELPQPGEEHAGVFRFPKEHVMKSDLRSDWITVK
jgi:hypothetical protein